MVYDWMSKVRNAVQWQNHSSSNRHLMRLPAMVTWVILAASLPMPIYVSQVMNRLMKVGLRFHDKFCIFTKLPARKD
jgi:hypothetical protein